MKDRGFLEEKSPNEPKKLRTAYIIPSLPFGINLEVKQSANAWWMDRNKVHQLFAAFSIRTTIPQACAHVGISLRQYKYFASLHPEIKEIREGFQLLPNIQAQKTIIKALSEGNVKIARWWLEKKDPEEFSSPSRRKGVRQIRREERLREIAQRHPQNPESGEAVKEALKAANEKLREILTRPPSQNKPTT